MSLPETQLPLVIRLRNANDQAAWDEFAATYAPFLVAFFRSRGIQAADCQDLTQQVLLAVSRHVGNWTSDGKPESFRRWLRTISRNAVLKFLSRDQKRPQAGGGTVFLNWLNQQSFNDAGLTRRNLTEYRQDVFRWALEQIRPEFRESTWVAFWRTSIDRESVEVVSQDLGMTAGAIYMARSRVMARLRECVQKFDPEDDTSLE